MAKKQAPRDDGAGDGPDEEEDVLAELLPAEGECRLSRPYARVRPILTKAGLRFACTHDIEHVSKPIAGLEAP